MTQPWFPGHMQATKRMIREHINEINVILEVVDARAPEATHHPNLLFMVGNKPVLRVLNREDLAKPEVTTAWLQHYAQIGVDAVAINAKQGQGVHRLKDALKKYPYGRFQSSLRLMVIGLPNLGKSSLLNRLLNRRQAKVGNTPGITRGGQWLRSHEDYDLFDLPGILTPKGVPSPLLPILGTMPDGSYDAEEAVFHLTEILGYQALLDSDALVTDVYVLLDTYARKRGLLMSGGRPDLEKAAIRLLQDFRNGVLGRFSLEEPL